MQDFCNGQLLFEASPLSGVTIRSALQSEALSTQSFLSSLIPQVSDRIATLACSLLLAYMALWVLKIGMLALSGTWI